MIRGFVTVGTTPFDQLLKAVDKECDTIELVCQIAGGNYRPRFHKSVRYVDDFALTCREVDFVITHAGAGSVYHLLENKILFVLVPNLERKDTHQTELASYVGDNRFAEVLSVEVLASLRLEDLVARLRCRTFEPYEKQSFFRAREIAEFVDGRLGP